MVDTAISSKIEKLLSGQKPEVDKVIARSGLDSTDDQALWITVVLKDDDPSRQTIESLEHWIVNTVTEAAPGYWPYLVFRTTSEQTQLDEELQR